MKSIVTAIFKMAADEIKAGASFRLHVRSRSWGMNDRCDCKYTVVFPKGKTSGVITHQEFSSWVLIGSKSISRKFKDSQACEIRPLVELILDESDAGKSGEVTLRIGASTYSWYPPSNGPGHWEDWMEEAEYAEVCAGALCKALNVKIQFLAPDGSRIVEATRFF